jgi:hypothetical protein
MRDRANISLSLHPGSRLPRHRTHDLDAGRCPFPLSMTRVQMRRALTAVSAMIRTNELSWSLDNSLIALENRCRQVLRQKMVDYVRQGRIS